MAEEATAGLIFLSVYVTVSLEGLGWTLRKRVPVQ